MPYFLKRLLYAIPLLIAMTFLSFTLMQLAPGDPTAHLMDPTLTAEDQARLKSNYGLDAPLYTQYWVWVSNAAQGNFGYSYINQQPVLDSILERLPATLLLSVTTLVLILLITFPLGVLSASKKDSRFDDAVTIFTFIGTSLPTFWVGLMFILFFSLQLDLFPTSGFMDPRLKSAPIWAQALSVMQHMALPLLTILIGGLAGLTRYHRFGTLKVLSQDYIRAARSRGIGERVILFKHAFKNAALPVVTLLGMSLPGLIGGSFVIEYIFSWPGMGQLGVNAVFARDYPVLMATLLFSSILIILGNLLADLAYAKLDPRIDQR